MARAPDPIERFARFLAQAERSPLTIKNYRGDLAAFAAWFEQVNGEAMAPAKVTPTDLRQYKRWLVEQRKLKPSSVNRKLATLKSFLTWAAAAGIAPGLPAPAQHRVAGPGAVRLDLEGRRPLRTQGPADGPPRQGGKTPPGAAQPRRPGRAGGPGLCSARRRGGRDPSRPAWADDAPGRPGAAGQVWGHGPARRPLAPRPAPHLLQEGCDL